MKIFDFKYPLVKRYEKDTQKFADYWMQFRFKIEPEPEKSDWHKQQVADLKKRLGIN